LATAAALYSSLTLLAMGCLALALSIIFRLKSRRLDNLPRELNANVFDRTFNVFDPYPVRIKIIHNFLTVLPVIAGVGSIVLAFEVWSLAMSGFLISIFIIIIGLNLIMIAEAPEIYTNSNVFVKAVEKNAKFAEGDLKVLQLVKKLASKLAYYYLGLAVLFTTFSATLQYIWNALPSLLTQIVQAIETAGGSNGILIVEVIAATCILSLGLLQIVAVKIKNRMFSYEIR
jgi:hypothetical protein